jgi:histidinol-phosphate phosphatase family protein
VANLPIFSQLLSSASAKNKTFDILQKSGHPPKTAILMNFSQQFLAEVRDIAGQLDTAVLERLVALLAKVREDEGRLFILGVGGSAANASHAVNDFRKIAGIEAYAPTDNVSELTARTNDEGWATVFESWLRVSRLKSSDGVLVLSVGGGDLEKQISPNLVAAVKYARSVGAKIMGIVGRDGGYTAKAADACAFRSVPSRNLAPPCLTSDTEGTPDQVGVHLVSSMVRRAVFLDRDGVLNKSVVRDGRPYPPASVRETVIVEDALSSLLRLKEQGFLLIVVTNQPDVSRGSTTRESVENIHRYLSARLPLDDIAVCYHDDRDACACRKPLPGLLLDAASIHGIALDNSYLVGDRWRDIDSGAAAGCQTILIDYGYNERSSTSTPDARVDSLSQAVDWILRQEAEPF